MCSSIAGRETSHHVKLKQRAVSRTLKYTRKSRGFSGTSGSFLAARGRLQSCPVELHVRGSGRKSVLEVGNRKEKKTLPLTLLTSLAHPFTSCLIASDLSQVDFADRGGAYSLDFVGNVVWYYPVALALHSCMVPIGVPASMRTRTQTVNHLCIF